MSTSAGYCPNNLFCGLGIGFVTKYLGTLAFRYSLQHLDSCQRVHVTSSNFLEMLLGFPVGFGGILDFFLNLGCYSS